MFQSRCVSFVCALAVVVAIPLIVSAQDTKNEAPKSGAPKAGAPAGGFKLTPNVVVQEEMDDTKLTGKVSFIMGFKLMSNFKAQGQPVNMGQLFEGMKAAAEGVDQRSFITGYQLMKNMQQNGADLDLNNVFEGMKLAQNGKELDMSDEQVNKMMNSFGKLVEQRNIEKIKKLSATNLAAGDAYVEKLRATNPKVKKLENGVMYEVLVEGTGPMPKPEDKVKIDYHGTFIDGTAFDSTVKPQDGRPPAPITHSASGFVPGFSTTIQAMKEGSKWRVVIPGPLAYGVSGPEGIGPNQTLIFELSLLEVIKKPNP